jgi:hypothetical protein
LLLISRQIAKNIELLRSGRGGLGEPVIKAGGTRDQ